MGRYCIICGRERPNERFGGKGRRRFTCEDCRKLPKAEQNRRLIEDELVGFMFQSNISTNNIERLECLKDSEIPRIAELATIILTVARIRPRKRRRVSYLVKHDRRLLDKLVQCGLIDEEQLYNLLPNYDFESADEEPSEAEFHEYSSYGLEDTDE